MDLPIRYGTSRFGATNASSKFGAARLFGSRSREATYTFRSNPHISFSKPEISECMRLNRFFSSPNHEKSIYLLNPAYKFNVFDFMNRTFTITTKNGSYKFNTDLLVDTSPIIREIITENPENLQYQLNAKDDENVMQKVEKMYQGETVQIDDSELYTFKIISEELDITQSLRNMNKKMSFSTKGSNKKVDKNNLQMDDGCLYAYLKDTMPKTFTIATRKKEYQCNRIGINSSNVLRELLSKDPSLNRYQYDFDDECNEFQPICDFFNFNFASITADNMNSMKDIAEDLQIEVVLADITNFIDDYEKRLQTIDDQQTLIDSINDLFETLYKIKDSTIDATKEKIIESQWSQTEEDVQELAAFILQVIRTDNLLHPYIADLLEALDKEADETNKLSILIPFIVQKLLYSIRDSSLISSFIYILHKRGFIQKEDIELELEKIFQRRTEKGISSRVRAPESLLIFLPEIFEMNGSDLDKVLNYFTPITQKFIKSYFPDKIDNFIQMRDSGEPDDSITKALRVDDVDTFQKIITKNDTNLVDEVVSYNIFEGYVPNGETNYINYAAAYGSLKCFKYLLLNHASLSEATFSFAIFGGNIEIVKITDQKLSDSDSDKEKKKPTPNRPGGIRSLFANRSGAASKIKLSYEKILPTIKKHQKDLFDWILEQKFPDFSKNRDLISNILVCASENGDSYSIASIVDKGYDFSSLDTKICSTVILNVSKNGFYHLLEFVSKILSKCIEQFPISRSPYSLQYSVLFGNLSIFKFYLEKTQTPNIQGILITAIENNYKSIVEYAFDNLLKNQVMADYGILLQFSIRSPKDDIFYYLIGKIEKMEPFPKLNMIQLLAEACINKKIEVGKKITSIILQHKKDDEDLDFSLPFYNAAVSGSTELCRSFVDQKVYIDYKLISMQVRELAAINKDILEIILNNMPPKAKDTITACYLEEAIRVKNKSFIEYLLKENATYEDALFDAVRTNDSDIVNMILEHNNDPAFINQTSEGGTALNIAVFMNNLAIVKRLLSVPKIDPSLYEANNQTPLITAIDNLNIEIINSILEFYGPDIKSQSWQLDEAVKKFLGKLSSEKRKNERPKRTSLGIRKLGAPARGPNGERLTFSQRLLARKAQQNNDQQNSDDSKFLTVLNRLLEIESIDLNCHADNYTLFTYACEANEIDIVEMMLENPKVDVNSYAPNNGNTPLLIAIDKQNIDIVRLLIECERTNINQRNYSKETALIMAVRKNLPEVVDIIVNSEKFNPVESRLDYAFYESDGEIAKKLSDLKNLDVNYKFILKNIDRRRLLKASGLARVRDDDDRPRPIGLARLRDDDNDENARIGGLSKLRLLRSRSAILNLSCTNELNLYRTTLINAVEKSNSELIDLIINHSSFNPEKSLAKEAVYIASRDNKVEIFKKLIQIFKGDISSLDEKNRSVIGVAIQNGSCDVFNDILESGIFDLSKYNIFDLFTCALNNPQSFPLLQKLLDYDKMHDKTIDFTKNLPNGKTVFTSVNPEYQDKISDLVQFFFDNGADPNIPDSFDQIPLIYAMDIHFDEYANLLIDSGKIDFTKKFETKPDPDSDIKGVTNRTYLHLIAEERFISSEFENIFNDIINSGVDVNSVDSNGETPLMTACRARNNSTVRCLFERDDLDYQKCNNDGDDALKILQNVTGKTNTDPTDTKESYLNSLITMMRNKSGFGRVVRSIDENEDNDEKENKTDDGNEETQQSKLGVKNKIFLTRKASLDAKTGNKSNDDEKASSNEQKLGEQSNGDDKESQNEDNSGEQSTGFRKPTLGSSKFGQASGEKRAFGSGKFGQASGEKRAIGAAKLSSQSSGEEKPTLGTSKFGQAIGEKRAFGAGKFGQSSGEKHTFGTAKLSSQSSGEEKPSSNEDDKLSEQSSIDEKHPTVTKSKFGQAGSEKRTFGSGKFGQSIGEKHTFGTAKLSSQSSGEEKPTLGTSKFGQAGGEKRVFGSSKFGQSSDEKHTFGTAKLSSQSSGEEKPTLGTSKFGQAGGEKRVFGSGKFGQSSDEKHTFGTAKLSSQSSGEEKPKSNEDDKLSEQSSIDEKHPTITKSKFGQAGGEKHGFGKEKFGQSSDESSHLKAESPIQSEILEAINTSFGDTGSLNQEQLQQLALSLSSIAEKRAKEINKSHADQKQAEREDNKETKPQGQFNERPNEEVEQKGQFNRRERESPSFSFQKRMKELEYDDRDDLDVDDQNQFNYDVVPSYQSQMFQQQWNQMMQIGNMRNAQFSMLMHQQEQMMIAMSAGIRKPSPEKQHKKKSQKKKKSHK